MHNQDRELIKDVNTIPFPARELYPLSSYEMYLKDRKATNIITSRDCPFECIFCFNMAGRTYRPRSAENVLAELSMLREKYGFRAFSIYDDNFTINKQRFVLLKKSCRTTSNSCASRPCPIPNFGAWWRSRAISLTRTLITPG